MLITESKVRNNSPWIWPRCHRESEFSRTRMTVWCLVGSRYRKNSPGFWPLNFQAPGTIRFGHSMSLQMSASIGLVSTSCLPFFTTDMDANGAWSVRLHPEDLQRANSFALRPAFESRKSTRMTVNAYSAWLNNLIIQLNKNPVLVRP
jgi:hypothetical protein